MNIYKDSKADCDHRHQQAEVYVEGEKGIVERDLRLGGEMAKGGLPCAVSVLGQDYWNLLLGNRVKGFPYLFVYL